MSTEHGSALDRLIEECGHDSTTDAARTELAALRRDLADARLMLRGALTQVCGMGPLSLRRSRGVGFKYAWSLGDGSYSEARLQDDGTGLPILTPEARAALEAK